MVVIALVLTQATGCYYWQAARGQLALTQAREPIDVVLEDATLPQTTRRKLEVARDAVAFAHRELDLPDNGSYRHFVALDRDYVVVNIFATPEFSLTPKRWCYPFAGCLSYRGYFKEAAAQRHSQRLSEQGNDVHLSKVPAYSTLGRLKDPILSTMLVRSEAGVASLLFHELAHQKIYVSGDTAFNESFATAVANIGIKRWRQARSIEASDALVANRALRKEAFRLIGLLRDDLTRIYEADTSEATKRREKADRFDQFAAAWKKAGLRSKPPMSNAALVPLAVYNDVAPAFEALFLDCGESFDCFYERVEHLAEQAPDERNKALDTLMPDS